MVVVGSPSTTSPSPCASKLYYMCCFIDSEMASPRELFISTPAPVNMHNYSTAQSSIIIIINNIAAFGINFNQSHACPKQNPRTFSKIYVNLHIRVKGRIVQCMAPGGERGDESWRDEGSTRIDPFGCHEQS